MKYAVILADLTNNKAIQIHEVEDEDEAKYLCQVTAHIVKLLDSFGYIANPVHFQFLYEERETDAVPDLPKGN